MSLETLYEQIHEEALPGIWSRGVALARERAVLLDIERPGELILRVKAPGKTVSPKVSVWPVDGDEDAHCDCGDRVEPCMHVVAAVVGLKNDWVARPESATGASGHSSPTLAQTRLIYRFHEQNGSLCFERVLVSPAGEEKRLVTSLVAHLGGLDSGRIIAAPLAVTREDFKIDQAVSQLSERGWLSGLGLLDPRAIPALLGALSDAANLELEGKPVRATAALIRSRVLIEDAPDPYGVRVSITTPRAERVFKNGACLNGDLLQPVTTLAPELQRASPWSLRGPELSQFVLRSLPALRQNAEIETRSSRLPELQTLSPWITLETHRDPGGNEDLEVMARLVYGDPPIAEVIEGEMELLSSGRHTGPSSVIPIRDEAEEHRCLQELRSELHLQPRQRIRLRGREAIDFLARSSRWKRTGGAEKQFRVVGDLQPELRGSGTEGLTLGFSVAASAAAKQLTADPQKVLAAWSSGESIVPLLDGSGWATIPKDWLNQNIERLEALLAARTPKSLLQKLQIAEFCAENQGELSSDLAQLRERLVEFKGIPEQKLPADLKASLRPYQRQGVNWLGFLRESGLGAILADDMGLGKTLQSLCSIRGRTLIIAPTSVLPSWMSQAKRFRPALRLNLYHGASRRLERHVDVTLTSYGTLRQDRALLTPENWDTIILDEAQHIKNPTSQIAQIVHQLKAGFRIALTGTPIENRLEDLWSQVQFAQPGLLGTRADFQSRFSEGRLTDLKRRIKPLILRRMKGEVAPELPPKTETVLYSELNENERKAYRTIFAGTQDTIVRELEAGGSILGALEALLRLRQICAHPALVPGFAEKEFTLSSKLELMKETLQEALDLGHGVLIFSQWTKLLDLVEKAIAPLGVEYLRLDGSTPNRGAVIDRFQDPKGPRVLLLSLKAGGVGLNLTKADHVMILDPWWNPAVEDQAADRAHRIGQTQPVLVQRLVAQNTVEEKILMLQAKKRELAAKVLTDSGESGPSELTRDELLELLR